MKPSDTGQAMGHEAAVVAGVKPGQSVTAIRHGAVGLCGGIAAQRLGAEQLSILGHHTSRTDLAVHSRS